MDLPLRLMGSLRPAGSLSLPYSKVKRVPHSVRVLDDTGAADVTRRLSVFCYSVYANESSVAMINSEANGCAGENMSASISDLSGVDVLF